MNTTQPVTAPATLRLKPSEEPFVVLSLIDLDPDLHQEVTQVAMDGHAWAVKARDDIHAGLVLSSEDRKRIVTVTSWRAQNAYLDSLHDDEASHHARQIRAMASRVRVCTYSLLAARNASGGDLAEVFVNLDFQCCVIWSVARDRQKRDFILNYNLWETERYIRKMDGFRFATFLSGFDPRDWAELTQWESTEAFRAALADPQFSEHMPVNNHYCEKDVSFARIVDVVSR
jgi:hypothetical protein